MVPGRRADVRGAGDDLTPPAEGPNGRVFVIFNPAAGRGRGDGRIGRYLELLSAEMPGFAHEATSRPGEERELAARAVRDGFDTVVAVGGDGTWSHVVDGMLSEAGPEHPPRFAVLPSGTGNDFGRNLGLDYRSPEAAVRALAAGRTTAVDVGRILTPSRPDRRRDEAPRTRFFLNLVGFGFDIAVIDAAAGARFLKGEILYKLAALQQLFRFPGMRARVENAEGSARNGAHLMLTISNGRFFGGGFPIAPDARVDDGLLHACHVGDASPLMRARMFGAAGKGRHVSFAGVEVRSSPSFRVTFDAPPRFEADGDVYASETGTVEVEVVPGALTVVG